MIVVEVYSKDDCHLCEVVKEQLQNIRARVPFELREIRIHAGHARYEEFKDRIPVVYINGEFAFQYRVSEERFLQQLKSANG